MWRWVCSDQSAACRADSHRAGHKRVAAALAGPDFDCAGRADEHHGAARQSSVAKWSRTLSSHGLRVFECSAFPLITGLSRPTPSKNASLGMIHRITMMASVRCTFLPGAAAVRTFSFVARIACPRQMERAKVSGEITLRLGLTLTERYIRRKPAPPALLGRFCMKVVRRR